VIHSEPRLRLIGTVLARPLHFAADMTAAHNLDLNEFPLTDAQVAAAKQYNEDRPYSKTMWRTAQAAVGAAVDGDPGAQTARCVAAFQARAGLYVDGQAGPLTLSALRVGQIFAFDDSAFFYHGGLAIDADGAPNAYNPSDTGIDYLANAGREGNWWGLACDRRGNPYLQEEGCPYPGHYVSATALCDGRYERHDPRRYVDSSRFPYVALPGNINDLIPTPTVRLGDLVVVARISAIENIVYAYYADVGPRKDIDPVKAFGEGSIKLAQSLGHDPYVMRGDHERAVRGISSGILYLVFPGSGIGKVLDLDQIEQRAAKGPRMANSIESCSRNGSRDRQGRGGVIYLRNGRGEIGS
jgi:peptidoglycan hydrolase-like protein with peptidoglycan-binding domain